MGGIISGVLSLAIGIFYIYAFAKVFMKANQPGWAAIIPLYNVIVLLKIAGKPIWWIFLLCIPFVGILLVNLSLAKSFGKSGGFGFGLTVLAPIFVPVLAFGDAQYGGPAG
ncbi:MAG TPA: DUF5684 domain-containing protein [Myxococcota bacterium]|jgi:hypothetical protein